MKRYLSLLLIFVMVMSFVPGAWAGCSITLTSDGNGSVLIDGYFVSTYTWPTAGPHTCTAAPNPGYHFKKWEDGNTDNPRIVTFSDDDIKAGKSLVFQAQFEQDEIDYSITLTSDGNGSVSIGGYLVSTYTWSTAGSHTCNAIPNSGYRFKQWNDGNTDNPRTVLFPNENGNNLSYTAIFEQDSIDPESSSIEEYTLKLEAYPPTMGTVEGNGKYPYNYIATAIAKPHEGYKFTGWSDHNGNVVGSASDRVLDVPMTANLEYFAHFAEEKSSPIHPTGYYQVTGITNPAGIAVLGGLGSHATGTFVTLTANQSMDTGYIFSHWNLIGVNDYNSLANPCIFVMPEGNVAATAVYTPVQAEFTITYSPGSNAKESSTFTQKKYRYVPVTLYMNQYTRDGYVQTGWTTDPNRNVIEYALGAQYYANANLVLYPTWGIPGQHYLTVTFNENGKDKVHTGSTVVTSGTVFPLKDDGSATFKFDTVGEIYPYNVKLNGVSKGSMDQIVVSGQAYDQTLEIDFESIYTKPKTGDDSAIFLWTVLGLSALACGAVSFACVRKRRKECS